MTEESEAGRRSSSTAAEPAAAHAADASTAAKDPPREESPSAPADSTPGAGQARTDPATPDSAGVDSSATDSSAADSSAADSSAADSSAADSSATDPSAAGQPATGAEAPGADDTADDRHRVAEHAADPVAAQHESWRQRRKRKKAQKKRRKAPWWELPVLVALAIGIAILVKTFLVQPFYIPSDSMEKTLHGCDGCHGDRILVNKLIYDFRDPHPGDIVVFHAPPGWNDEPIARPPSNPVLRVVRGFGQLIGFVPPDGQVLVKRVIAVGGQTVKGDTAGHVYINGRKLNEPYVFAPKSQGRQPAFGPVTVPSGRLWVMGDHRTDSADSRYHCVPLGPEGTGGDRHCNPQSSTVPVSDVIGKAFVIAWPPSRWRTLGTPPTFENAAAAAGPLLPGAVSAVAVAPIFIVRRRRRHRRGSAGGMSA